MESPMNLIHRAFFIFVISIKGAEICSSGISEVLSLNCWIL